VTLIRIILVMQTLIAVNRELHEGAGFDLQSTSNKDQGNGNLVTDGQVQFWYLKDWKAHQDQVQHAVQNLSVEKHDLHIEALVLFLRIPCVRSGLASEGIDKEACYKPANRCEADTIKPVFKPLVYSKNAIVEENDTKSGTGDCKDHKVDLDENCLRFVSKMFGRTKYKEGALLSRHVQFEEWSNVSGRL
jgi:hypothetical protein